MKRWLRAVFVVLLGLLWGCTAPHDNPLDPESSRYQGTQPEIPDLTGRAISRHISQTDFSDIYSVRVELTGADAVLLDSAAVIYDGRTAVPLGLSGTTWATGFSAGYIGDTKLASVFGVPFLFHAYAGIQEYEYGPAYVWRVIETVPTIVAPYADDTVSVQPILEWDPYSAGFPFVFMAEIVRSEANIDSTIWTLSDVPSSALSAQPSITLRNGTHYWTITVVDSFGNTARSKKGWFYVDSTLSPF